MEDKDNFFGYFLFQMGKEIRFSIADATSVTFKGTRYILYFNPLIFLALSPEQMETSIKHQILHVVSMHLVRAKELKGSYSKQAINLAMDVVVNTYLDHLPPFSTTIDWVNINFDLLLTPFESFEYYVEKIQTALDLRTDKKDAPEEGSRRDETIAVSYSPDQTHDAWDESDDIDEQTLRKFTAKYIDSAHKGQLSNYLESMISALKAEDEDLPWHWYLKKLVGSIASGKKKTTARRNRRQPERLDLPATCGPTWPGSSSPSTSAAASATASSSRPCRKSSTSSATISTTSPSSNATTKSAASIRSASWPTSKTASRPRRHVLLAGLPVRQRGQGHRPPHLLHRRQGRSQARRTAARL